MKKSKKVLALLLASVLTTGMITGCGTTPTSPASGTSTPDKKESSAAPESAAPSAAADNKEDLNQSVTLKVTTMMAGTDANAPNYQKVLEAFSQKYPNVKVEDSSKVADNEWKAQIAADFSLNNEPDVIQFYTDAIAVDVLKTDKFVTLAEIQAYNPEIAKNTTEIALKSTTSQVDGKNYAVPTVGFWEGLYCNKDLFDQYNLELPTDWDKLITAIKTFKENGVTPVAVSLNHIPQYWIEHLMLSASSKDEFNQIPADTTAPETWVKGLSYFKELRDLGAFPEDTDVIDNDMAGELFKSKKAAMQLDGSWYANGVTEKDTTVVLPFPAVPGSKLEKGVGISGFSSGFYITKRAWEDPVKREAAVNFVLANTNDEQVLTYWSGSGACSVPVPEGYVEGLNLAVLQNSGAEFAASITQGVGPTDSRIAGEAFQSLVDNIVGISHGEMEPKEAVEGMLTIYHANK